MALYVPGQQCAVCGRRVESAEAKVLFPQFTSNQADPLFKLSDAVVHAACLEQHPEVERLKMRLADFDRARSKRVKLCTVCGQQITNPDEYFTLGFLGDNESARGWNYSDFHHTCLPRWVELLAALQWTERAIEQGQWTKASMHWLQTALREAESMKKSEEKGGTEEEGPRGDRGDGDRGGPRRPRRDSLSDPS
jgi:hypothetical protein